MSTTYAFLFWFNFFIIMFLFFSVYEQSNDLKVTLMKNSTEVTHFLLLGLTDDPGLQLPLFLIFLFIYTITLVGNLGMILLIVLDSRLHTPMYFFLCNLSLVDFCYSSAVTPTVMTGLLIGNKIISYNGCAAQMFFFCWLCYCGKLSACLNGLWSLCSSV
jgi:hypothetical protein